MDLTHLLTHSMIPHNRPLEAAIEMWVFCSRQELPDEFRENEWGEFTVYWVLYHWGDRLHLNSIETDCSLSQNALLQLAPLNQTGRTVESWVWLRVLDVLFLAGSVLLWLHRLYCTVSGALQLSSTNTTIQPLLTRPLQLNNHHPCIPPSNLLSQYKALYIDKVGFVSCMLV